MILRMAKGQDTYSWVWLIICDRRRTRRTINYSPPHRGETPASPHNQVYQCEAERHQRGTRAYLIIPALPAGHRLPLDHYNIDYHGTKISGDYILKESIVQQARWILKYYEHWLFFQTNEWVETIRRKHIGVLRNISTLLNWLNCCTTWLKFFTLALLFAVNFI